MINQYNRSKQHSGTKCAIIGCGFVGAACANALMQSMLFSELVLIDINEKRAAGEAADISHGMAFTRPGIIRDGRWADMAGADAVVICAGANQPADASRLSLTEQNIRVLDSILPHIGTYAHDAVILIVTNPVDILTRHAVRYFGGDRTSDCGYADARDPAIRIFGSGTVLDTGRLRYLLGEHFGIDNRNIHAFVIGEHGDSALAVWSGANVSGIDMDDYCRIAEPSHSMEEVKAIFSRVQASAYRIIDGKGATYYGIAMAVVRILSAVMRDERSVLTVSAYLRGAYGIRDAAIGVPAIVGRGGIQRILEIPLSREERQGLHKSIAALYPEVTAATLR